jgi:hypothetical protein
MSNSGAKSLMYCTEWIDIVRSIQQISYESKKVVTLAQNVSSLRAHLRGYTGFSVSFR